MNPTATRLRARLRRGRRAIVPLGLLAIGLGIAVLSRDVTGVVIGVLVANAGFAAWAGSLIAELLRHEEPPATPPVARGAARRRLSDSGAPADPTVGSRRSDVAAGDYLASSHELYRVEHVRGRRVLLEDCVSGGLIDIDISDCARLDRVKRSTGEY